MFGKHFSSMYCGSMFGKPAIVFAVWGYVISMMRPSRKDGQCYVELNPTLLAATFSTTPEEILDAITTLSSPDQSSRSKQEDGRRLVTLNPQMIPGPMQFRVVNGPHYRGMRDEEERRTYLRDAKRQERAAKPLSTKLLTVNRRQPPSSQAEAEAEAEAVHLVGLAPDEGEGVKTEVEQKGEPKPKCWSPGARVALAYLNEKAGRHFRETDINLGLIQRRLDEVFGDVTGVRQMIDRMCERWLGTEYAEFLRPGTLFGKEKFGSYYDNRDIPIPKNENSSGSTPQRVNRNLGTANADVDPTEYDRAEARQAEARRLRWGPHDSPAGG